jgi:outer membrane biosynthesis protein TonB
VDYAGNPLPLLTDVDARESPDSSTSIVLMAGETHNMLSLPPPSPSPLPSGEERPLATPEEFAQALLPPPPPAEGRREKSRIGIGQSNRVAPKNPNIKEKKEKKEKKERKRESKEKEGREEERSEKKETGEEREERRRRKNEEAKGRDKLRK